MSRSVENIANKLHSVFVRYPVVINHQLLILLEFEFEFSLLTL